MFICSLTDHCIAMHEFNDFIGLNDVLKINKTCRLQSLQTTQFHFCQTGDNCWEAQGGVEEDVNQFIISPAVALSSHTAAMHYSQV